MTTAGHRLPSSGRIDRTRTLSFKFDGKRLEGHPGDTLASALLAGGASIVGRSFKYHRPRGILSAGVEEPNALVQLGFGAETLPNLPATMVELYDGLEATSVSGWPSARHDVGAVAQWVSAFLPAGFYYKTFMWPPHAWMTYERFIRRAAGLGTAPTAPDPDIYDKTHAHCDVLVVGGGPAGLAAALAAGRSGARVILAEQQAEFGGRLLDERREIDGAPAMDWAASALAELSGMEEVRLLSRTTAFGYYDDNLVVLAERRRIAPAETGRRARERLWKVRARQVVLATGAIERPLVFPDNDRPGVMLASAVRAYVHRYGVAPGRAVVVVTNSDDAYRTALTLADAGLTVPAIVDLRRSSGGALRDAVDARGIEVLSGWGVAAVRGARRVRRIAAAPLDGGGSVATGARRTFRCDTVAVSGGWSPTLHLFSQSGGKTRFDQDRGCFVPAVSVQAERSAGAAAGTWDLDGCLGQGFAAGAAAAAEAGFGLLSDVERPRAEPEDERPAEVLQWSGRRGGKQFIDLHNDVTVADIQLASREGYESVELAKRYTTLGMGTDQGKTGNLNGLAVLAAARGAAVADLGTTTFRPPYTPVTFGALAGRDVGAFYDPERITPMHAWHVAAGAAFEDVGQWKRPRYYPQPGETMADAVNRECLAARRAVGILDASTLGKIDIRGPDAAEFLNRVYTNAWTKLEIGRCRYGLMCTEDGMVFDDGVTARLGEAHYLMSTTSGGAERVMAWLEEWLQTEWPDLRVFLTSVTEQWATASVSGPSARQVLRAVTDLDLSAQAFPHMTVCEGEIAGLPARVFRVSFTGEVSFEVNVPAGYGAALWTALMAAGQAHGITPFGTEAMHVLRAEKGYVIVGQDTDGSVTPIDLGVERLVSRTKDFLGKRSLGRTDSRRPDRRQLIGLKTENPNEVLPEGGQVVAEVRLQPPMKMIGHVTSSYFSANLGRSIALALIDAGRSRIGETVFVPLADRTVGAEIVPPVFFDPDGKRLHD